MMDRRELEDLHFRFGWKEGGRGRGRRRKTKERRRRRRAWKGQIFSLWAHRDLNKKY